MVTNAEIESYWIDLWSDLYDFKKKDQELICLLPNGESIAFDDCLRWVQQAVYSGKRFTIEEVVSSLNSKTVMLLEIKND